MTALPSTEQKSDKTTDVGASRRLDVHRWSDYPELRNCLANIVQEINVTEERTRARTQRGANQLSDAVRCIVLDLYVAWCADPTLEIAVSLSKSSFSKGTRYEALYFTYDTFRPALNGLIKLGLVEVARTPFHDPRTGIGRVTRLRATPRLIEVLTGTAELTLAKLRFRGDRYAEEVIVLRNELKNDIEYKETKSTTNMRAELARINESFASHWLDLELSDRQTIALNARMANDHRHGSREAPYVDLAAKRLRRVFNNGSWNEGGRFYGGWWQFIPREHRTHITIDGKRTVEIDYSGMHPALMYAEVGAKLDGDAYDIGETSVKRDTIKRTFNQMVNASGRIDPKSDFREEECGLSWKELQDKIKTRHSPIARFLGTGYGVRLQNVDSQIANRIMLQFISKQYVCLPVHDSFIVLEALQDDLTEVMHDEFMKQCGAHITTKPKFDVTIAQSTYAQAITGEAIQESLFPAGEFAGHETRLNNWWSSRV